MPRVQVLDDHQRGWKTGREAGQHLTQRGKAARRSRQRHNLQAWSHGLSDPVGSLLPHTGSFPGLGFQKSHCIASGKNIVFLFCGLFTRLRMHGNGEHARFYGLQSETPMSADEPGAAQPQPKKQDAHELVCLDLSLQAVQRP